MKIHVYDTHVLTAQGQHIHFDVLVNDEHIERVQEFAEQYLAKLKVPATEIKQHRCNFCHSEVASPNVQQQIAEQGHSIIRL
ncbi:hypothetical protein tinsulaeT_16340 [Thalassotalea insulae]|uniref:DUF2024 family protein n=1 Tax=Thalassotalea insulae TaxID=2056778 RepID=A0ABQ6GT07_9GAMM|nr:DUF2024 family protein [Thalassotalea insulae]GLX78294.1 hypothetical protein tinsulaeT_16340 [Thalassotalea insulae]